MALREDTGARSVLALSPRTPSVSSWSADLECAVAALTEAEINARPSDRFLASYLAALRGAAAVLSRRAQPGRTSRPRNVWELLARVAPELGEWAIYFHTTHAKREAVRAGAVALVTARQADDLVRDARAFLELINRGLAESDTSRLASSQT